MTASTRLPTSSDRRRRDTWRVASALLFVALLFLVHAERRLAEVQFNLASTSELQGASTVDRDEIALRLIGLLHVELPAVNEPDQMLVLPAGPSSVGSLPQGPRSAPTPRSPPFSSPVVL